MSDKRNFHRACRSQPVRFQFPDPRKFGNCLSKDLSEGGVRIRLTDFISVNTKLALKIRLAGEDTIHCTGCVVWVEKDRYGDGYQAGLEFSRNDLALDDQEKICGFLSHQ